MSKLIDRALAVQWRTRHSLREIEMGDEWRWKNPRGKMVISTITLILKTLNVSEIEKITVLLQKKKIGLNTRHARDGSTRIVLLSLAHVRNAAKLH